MLVRDANMQLRYKVDVHVLDGVTIKERVGNEPANVRATRQSTTESTRMVGLRAVKKGPQDARDAQK